MGYTGPYSLRARCASEVVATLIGVFLGNGCIANTQLSRTKGHGQPFGWIALGYGLSFGFGIQILGTVSAHINPASCVALWVTGELAFWPDVLALSACEVAGAFIGAVLVWVVYLPHFKTIPEPPSEDPRDDLLCTTDAPTRNARQYASYNTEDSVTSRRKEGMLKEGIQDIAYYMSPSPVSARRRRRADLRQLLRDVGEEQYDLYGRLRRHSVQVGELHGRLEGFNDVGRLKDQIQPLTPSARSASGDIAGLAHIRDASLQDIGEDVGIGQDWAPSLLRRPTVELSRSASLGRRSAGPSLGMHLNGELPPVKIAVRTTAPDTEAQPALPPEQQHSHETAADKELTRQLALHHAAVIVDQNTKLSVFSTRPAIYAPLFNWITEFICTAFKVAGVQGIEMQSRTLYQPVAGLFPQLSSLYYSLWFFLVILGVGGPTAAALNPARDFGPRMAHWVLPIPNKGPSEWRYGWVPVTAGLAGGLLAGAMIKLLAALLQQPQVDSTVAWWQESSFPTSP